MDVREYVAVLLRQRRLVVAVMAVTLAAALAFLALKQSPWTAEATVAVEPGTAVVGGDVRQDDISYLERLVNTYATLGASRDVREGVARRVGLPHAPEVQVTPVPSTNLMTVEATTSDARSAARAADAVAAELIEQVRKSSADAVKAAESSFMRRRAALEADIAQASVQLDSSRGSGDRTAERQLRERIASDRASLDAQRETYENYQAGREARAGSISLVTPALHAMKASRGIEQVIVVALLLGGVAAAGLAFVAENLSGSFRTRAELEASVDSLVLAAIPRVSGASRHATFNGGSHAEEAFRRLRTNFLLQVREDVQTVLVTSADPGEGKTTVVANLGRSLAQSGRSVVLVDADLRAPRLHEFFGEPVAPGLGDVLTASPDSRMPSEGRSSNGKAAEAGLLRRITHALREGGDMRRTELAAAVGHASNGGTFTRALKLGVATGVLATTGRGTYQLVDRLSDGPVGSDDLGVRRIPSVPGLALLPAGRSIDDPATLLGSRAAERLLKDLRRTFDFVLVDSPAVRAVPDALAIRYSVDDVLLVAGADVHRDALRLTHDELARAGAPPMGIVLNSASDRGLYPYVAYPSRHRDDDVSREDEAGMPETPRFA
jgi:Mrp family chromosome partitioning ATPase